ncbi:MAG TPA: SpoIIE family protein phosphatase [Anaerolineales bacterium]|nr:SpoIIE family protein phosphatase [Anaerolineales bacterium]
MRLSVLRKIPLFASLPTEERRYLASRLTSHELPVGHILFREGSQEKGFYILLEGEVEVLKSADTSNERSLGKRKAVSLIGEMSLFTRDGHRTATVRAITPLSVLKMKRKDFDVILHRQPQLAYELIGLLSNRLDESENLTIIDLKEKNRKLRKAYRELKAAQEQIIEKEKLEHELELSGKIQQSILPQRLPRRRGFDFGALMIPAFAVGGDFYNFLRLDKKHLGIVVGDVCDKGVPAALFMSLVYSLIRVKSENSKSPVKVLRQVNSHLMHMMNTDSTMFVTLVYGILNLETGRFHYARAAHPAPIILDQAGHPINVPIKPGQPLGLFGNLPIDEESITIPHGGALLLFTDGLNEASNKDGSDFGDNALIESFSANLQKRAQLICESLWDAVQEFSEGLPQGDDFTVLAIKRLATK